MLVLIEVHILQREKIISWEGPSDILTGFPLSKTFSHNFIVLWSSLRCPHFGSLGNPISHKIVGLNFQFFIMQLLNDITNADYSPYSSIGAS